MRKLENEPSFSQGEITSESSDAGRIRHELAEQKPDARLIRGGAMKGFRQKSVETTLSWCARMGATISDGTVGSELTV
jgi:hypothetical protein